ncbi:MAG: hypothetical protein HOJ90_08525 [Alphaproteobacteria bacterium]|jgi:hypothetical protein|nr:hypothetical protein [Alphaproteobacteria bacterium]
MIKHTTLQAARILPGLALALLILTACASGNTGERDDLKGYDRFILNQVGGD